MQYPLPTDTHLSVILNNCCSFWDMGWRMEKISSIAKTSNEEVLQRVQESRNIINSVRQCKRRWTGHNLRHQNFLCDTLEGRMLRKTTRGRKQLNMRA